MFDIAPSELLLVAIVALVVIGPKDLPRVLRVVGQWVGRARGMARHFRSGFDEMVRQSEMEEMEKRWASENARIMAEHPNPAPSEESDDAHFAAAAFAQPALPIAEAEGTPDAPPQTDDTHAAALAASTQPMPSLTSPGAAAEVAAAPGNDAPPHPAEDRP